MDTLSFSTLRKVKYDGYVLENAPEKVLQFGEGGFLRAFIDYFIDMMNEKAAELGLTCSPEVTCQLQDGVPFPVEVTMDISKNAALSEIIAADLGIDEGHQRWRETE